MNEVDLLAQIATRSVQPRESIFLVNMDVVLTSSYPCLTLFVTIITAAYLAVNTKACILPARTRNDNAAMEITTEIETATRLFIVLELMDLRRVILLLWRL
jgi:hypothetical protein